MGCRVADAFMKFNSHFTHDSVCADLITVNLACCSFNISTVYCNSYCKARISARTIMTCCRCGTSITCRRNCVWRPCFFKSCSPSRKWKTNGGKRTGVKFWTLTVSLRFSPQKSVCFAVCCLLWIVWLLVLRLCCCYILCQSALIGHFDMQWCRDSCHMSDRSKSHDLYFLHLVVGKTESVKPRHAPI